MHNAYYNCTNLPFPVAGSSLLVVLINYPRLAFLLSLSGQQIVFITMGQHTHVRTHTHTPESSFKTSLKTSISPLAVVRDFFEALSELRGAVRVFLGEN